jgi:hypothetical protein
VSVFRDEPHIDRELHEKRMDGIRRRDDHGGSHGHRLMSKETGSTRFRIESRYHVVRNDAAGPRVHQAK